MADIANWSWCALLPAFLTRDFMQLYKKGGICVWEKTDFLALGQSSFGGEESSSDSTQLVAETPMHGSDN